MQNNVLNIDLNGMWLVEGMDPEEGLARKAYSPEYQPQKPICAQVPCIVQSALLEAGIIEDPYYETNAEKILWVEEKEWWFFKEFDIPDMEQHHSYYICLEGITYKGTLWVNGLYVDSLEGTFKKYNLNVTDYINAGGKNSITIRLKALENSSEDRNGGKIPRGTLRSTGVVAPFSYWWNWSPHIVPIGIWKSVALKVTGGAMLEDSFVTTDIHWTPSEEAERADIHITVDVHSDFKEEKEMVVKATIRGIDFDSPEYHFERTVMIKPGHNNKLQLDGTIVKPKLWWPNGMGAHPLYLLTLAIENADGSIRFDCTDVEFGIREIKMVCNTDDIWVQEVCGHKNRPWSIVGNPYPWTFTVNHKKMFVRGTNWVPCDNLFRFTEERYKLFLDQAESANLNMLRVWGGGIHETETFYKLCDRKGLLTWAEFWLACASYPAMPHKLFIDCAIDMIKTIRNHASLAIWSGGNEYNPDEPENKVLVDKLEAACKSYDPTRSFHRGSPYKGDRHGGLVMLPTRTSNKYRDILRGDSRMTLFRSEVATGRSIPVLESVKKFIGEDKIWPIDRKVWQYHHANVKEQESDALVYGAEGDLEHWMMAGQILHGQSHRHNLEYCRQTKYYCSGCMQWQLNVSWPAFHRELIDWYGIPKPAFYAYKRAAQDYLVLADLEKYIYDANEDFTTDVYVVNDKQLRTGKCTVKARLYNFHMDSLYEHEQEIMIEADSTVKVFTLHWKIPEDYCNNVFFLHLEIRKYGEVLADNLYWMGVSSYCRPNKVLDLSGVWKVQVGMKIDEIGWKNINMPAYWHDQSTAPAEGDSVYFMKKVIIPEAWKGEELEFFCAGIEGYDEVLWNGAKIGSTECDYTSHSTAEDLIYTENWNENSEEKTSGEGLINVRFSADPVIIPNLVKRFYSIPSDQILWGKENVLIVRLYGKDAYGISEPVFIRKESTDQQIQAIVEYNHRGKYLAGMRELPEVDLYAEIYCGNTVVSNENEGLVLIRLKNTTSRLAFFTGVKPASLEDVTTLIYSDNYFSILPGAEKEIFITIPYTKKYKGLKEIQFEIYGWNVKAKKIGEKIEMMFE